MTKRFDLPFEWTDLLTARVGENLNVYFRKINRLDQAQGNINCIFRCGDV